VPFGYDDSVEKKLVPSNTVRLLGLALREARANRALSTPVGTAALTELCDNIETYGVEMALWLFTAMFQPQEIPKVQTIISDRSIEMLLKDEQQAKIENVERQAQAQAQAQAPQQPTTPLVDQDWAQTSQPVTPSTPTPPPMHYDAATGQWSIVPVVDPANPF
jgi:hypothetical protein